MAVVSWTNCSLRQQPVNLLCHSFRWFLNISSCLTAAYLFCEVYRVNICTRVQHSFTVWMHWEHKYVHLHLHDGQNNCNLFALVTIYLTLDHRYANACQLKPCAKWGALVATVSNALKISTVMLLPWTNLCVNKQYFALILPAQRDADGETFLCLSAWSGRVPACRTVTRKPHSSHLR